jgi:c-di-GMP-binding flagellar brake protein YcgR
MQKTERQTNRLPLNLWDRIELVVGREGEEGTYVSRVEDFNSQGLIITKPDFVGGHTLLTAHSKVYVHFMRPDALYRFSALLKTLPDHVDNKLLLHTFGQVERVQRRQFVRVDMRLDLKYALLKKSSGSLHMGDIKWFNSYSSNVSAGGLLMKVDTPVQKDDLLLIKIGKYEMLGIPRLLGALCCRIIRIEDGRFAGVEFITDRKLPKCFSQREIDLLPGQVKGFTTQIQNRMVKFIFEQQVKERQKGLI